MSQAQAPDGARDAELRVEDLRATPRFALLLRSAKLIGTDVEHLCIVRDVSQSGCKLRLFTPIGEDDQLALEVSTGERLPVELIWERDGEAGFRFREPIDVTHFVAESGPYPKRPIRVRVDHPARLSLSGQVVPVTLQNLSRQGAGIETDMHLAIGQKMLVEAEGLPTFEATVCWRQHPQYGLVFGQLMSLSELAERSYRLQRHAAEATARSETRAKAHDRA